MTDDAEDELGGKVTELPEAFEHTVTILGDCIMTIALALVAVSADEEGRANPQAAFDALSEEERAYMLEAAGAAMQAHLDWLLAAGFRTAPPGTMLRPKNDNDARAMILAGQEFLAQPEHARQRRKSLVGRPALIVPPGTKH